MTWKCLIALTGFTLAFLPFLPAAPSAELPAKPEYNRDIRPILAENCFKCHGPDSAARQADLRLDLRDQAIEAGVIVPGKPDESEVVQRIFARSQSKRMPPAKSNKKLTDDQKELLRRWIAGGAEYQPHWSFIPPKRPNPPAVKNEKWVRNPIDRFILAELEKRGLQPAPEADRHSLARRVSLDLTGLPPSPGEVAAFVNDRSPNAYEKLVDRLLQSPHWGEHRGRYWLDAARYADTHGIHFDNYREMWSYRDWVINAFNRNLPFDQFTVEQLAGDLLPNRTQDQIIASGFNRCNITTNEGGAIAEEYEVLYTRDRTETTAQVWLGMTAGCAVCHDHKFDPLTQKEFYEMAAFFNNTTQKAMDGNIKDTPPILVVPRDEDRPRWEAISKELPATQKQIEDRRHTARPEFDKWLAQARPTSLFSALPREVLKFHAWLGEGGNAISVAIDGHLQPVVFSKPPSWQPGHVVAQAFQARPDTVIELDDVGDFEKNQSFSSGAWVKLTHDGQFGSVLARMDNNKAYRGWDLWLENNRVGVHLVNQWDADAIKVLTNQRINTGEWTHLFMTYNGSGKARGIQIYVNGVRQPTTIVVDRLKNTIRTSVPFTVAQRHTEQRLDDLLLNDLRIYGRALPEAEVTQLVKNTRVLWLVGLPPGKRTAEMANELFAWWLPAKDKPFQDLNAKVGELTKEQTAIKGRGTVAHVMQEKDQAAMAYILNRGEYDQRKDPVHPALPKILPPMSTDLPKNRLGFAKWLLKPDHPLTARVTVNRFWQEVFGNGLVRTAGDFGVTGELPSHPELLDWLAVEFRESGWDVKKFFKLLVTSATYRQAAVTTPEKREKDPQNRFLSRGPRFRMDAEMIRDNALASSGLLVRKLGGPSVKPYMPEGVWEAVAMIGSNTRNYKADSGESLYRRSLYTFWKRSAPPAQMDILNAPNRETCTVRRDRTNTPLQALVTLNDVQFVEAARHLAQRALKESGDKADGRFDFVAKRLLARPFRPEELQVAQAGLQDLLSYYQSHAEDAKKLIAVGESKADATVDAAELAAWTMLVNQLMNLDEVLNK